MKRFLLATQCLLLLLAADALAVQDTQSCEAKSKQLKPKEQEAFLTACLAQVSSPANVREATQLEKRRVCEQNAKNHSLQGNEKAKYLNACENSNEAAALAKGAAKETAKNKPMAPQAARPSTSTPPAAAKPVHHPRSKHACEKEARQKGLKGNARNKYIGACHQA